MQILHGNNIDLLKTLPDNSVDSIVTDPPYGLSFMNKKWDYDVPSVELWQEVYRVLKHGGHVLSFGGTRTYHRMVVNIEDAGFEIRDQIMWLYGSGFPKSHNIEKAIESQLLNGSSNPRDFKKLNGEKSTTQLGTFNKIEKIQGKRTNDVTGRETTINHEITTEEAKQWKGWGTALKPANEPICLARKPLSEKSVSENVLKHGTGGINIDGCRVSFQNEEDRKESTAKNQHADFGTKPMTNNNVYGDYSMVEPKNYDPQGRFPANVIHDGSDEVVQGFPNENGSASRFFYCAKASKSDREDGNNHPTVKPTELMRYLCRLITPPNGIVLDPFMGSGSTGKGAILEGFDFIGMELDPEYVEIAKARIFHAQKEYEQSQAQQKLF